MILSDREIRAALYRQSLKITPDPRKDESVWSSTAIDLHLDKDLAFWVHPGIGGVGEAVCPFHLNYNYAQLVEQFGRTVEMPVDGYPLPPGSFHLGWTEEMIQLPFRSRIAARVEGKSSLACLGMGVHVTAPTIHAGFGYNEGNPNFPGNPIQLEIGISNRSLSNCTF